jgi:hypothetical protein
MAKKKVPAKIEEKLPVQRKTLILRVAAIIYAGEGYRVPKHYDFSRAVHPAERAAWNTAVCVLREFFEWASLVPMLREVKPEDYSKAHDGLLPEEYAL